MSFGVFKQQAASISPLECQPSVIETTWILPRLDHRLALLKHIFGVPLLHRSHVIIVLLDYLAGCRQVLPASHRFHRTCPPSTALKRSSSGTILPLVIAHSWFGSLLTHRNVCSFWSV
ncbi:hypothetical protein ATANTOWER_012917 [Ataeniobius toweri]|uniref:Uncharacterized protein n=1 Tax=Ataeniobius toweri TaxID=208326 RepID=A0ABU7BFX4_9TELE|nr:hypothetical protein [Ataeniobius toweri]